MKDFIFNIQLFASSINSFTVTGTWNTDNGTVTAADSATKTALTTLLNGTSATISEVSNGAIAITGASFSDLKKVVEATGANYAVTLTSDLTMSGTDSLALKSRLRAGSGCSKIDLQDTASITGNSSTFIPANGQLIQVNGSTTLEITGTGTISTTKASEKGGDTPVEWYQGVSAVSVVSGTLNITGSIKISAAHTAISGTYGHDATAITIGSADKSDNPTITSTSSVAVFKPQGGTLTINSGTISGTTGVENHAGALTISGGTITATGTYAETGTSYNKYLSNMEGVAVALSPNEANAIPTVTISGGTLKATGSNGKAIVATKLTDDSGTVQTYNITGGTFSSNPIQSASGNLLAISIGDDEGVYNDTTAGTYSVVTPSSWNNIADGEWVYVGEATQSVVTGVGKITETGTTKDGKTTYAIKTVTNAPNTTTAVTFELNEQATLDASNVKYTPLDTVTAGTTVYSQFTISDVTYTPKTMTKDSESALVKTVASTGGTITLTKGDDTFRILNSGATVVTDYAVTALTGDNKAKVTVATSGMITLAAKDGSNSTVDSITITKIGETSIPQANQTLAAGSSIAVLDGILYTGTISAVSDDTNAVSVTGTDVTATQITTSQLAKKTFTLGDANTKLTVDSITYSGAQNGTIKVNSDAVTIGAAAVTATGTATELAKKTFTLDASGSIKVGESGVTYSGDGATVKDAGTTATVTGDITVTTGDISAKTFTLGTSSKEATLQKGTDKVTYSSKGGTVKIGAESTDITGTVKATFSDNTGSITVGGVKYTSGANPSYVELTNTNNKITAALDAKSGTITVTPASTGSVTVSDVTYTGDGTGTIKFVNGDVTEFAAGTVTASIAAGKKLTYSGITYTENSGTAAAEVVFTAGTPSLGTGAVKITGNNTDAKALTINDVKYQSASETDAIIFTTKDSVTSASIIGGTETATFTKADASAIIGNIKYTATTANEVAFTKNNTDSASLVSAVAEAKGLQLATANSTTNNNTYTYANATINAAVGTATLTGAGTGAAVTISGSAVDTVNVKGVTSAYKLNDKALNISGDTDYTVLAEASGDKIGAISGITAGVTVAEAANVTLQTDKAGKFTFGTTAYNITGDNEVTFVTDENSKVANVADFTGVLNAATGEVTVNGVGFTTSNTDTSVVGAEGGIAGVYGLVSGDTIGGSLDGVSISMAGSASSSTLPSVLTIGDNVVSLTADTNGVVIKDNEITGLAANASLQVANAGTYVVNGTTLTVAAGDVVRGTSEETAEIYDPSNVAEVNESVAAAVESLASAIINTEDYEDLSKDTTKLAEVTKAINATSASADKSALNGDMKFAVSVPSGSNSQDVDLSANTGKKDVTLTTGNQSLKFNNEGGNVAEIGKDASGDKNVELGNGGDVVAIAKGADKKATINITAGTGPDTVVSGANASVDVGKGGATKVRAVSGATVTMNNYNAADSKAGVQTTNSDIAAAIGNGNIELTNGAVTTKDSSGKATGTVQVNSGSSSADVVTSADAGDTEGSTIVNLYNNAGKMTKVGFTHSDGGTVDLSSQKANTVIQGNSTGSKKNESTLLGGSGNDVIYAGSGDVIDAGAGANKITLSSSANAEVGATVQMTSATGRNTVDGFNYGFGDNNDAISLDMTNAKFSIDDSNNLIVKNGRAKSTLLGASADGDTSYAQVLIKDTASGETTKAAVAKEGNVISVSSDEDNFANNYIGDGSGLSFSSYESEVNLNLAGTTATFGGEEVQVSGINNVTLGEADATVFGSSAKETITAGNGNETIWAGAGKDTLNGYSGNADDKSGSITFGFMAGDGKDVINNFGYLTTENAQTADRVWTTGQFEAALSGNDVVLSFSGNKKDSLRLTGMAGKNIQLSENGDLNNVTTVLQVSDTLLTYDGLATKYVATGSNAAVVATSDTATANIWLEDKYVNLSNNTTYTGKITAVNAAAVEGQATLVGNSYNNVITGAQGSSSMWGGDSTSNDTMIGGTEGNMFFYGVTGGNEGNDSISGITEDDTVNLFGIQLADISDFDITNSTIALKFSAGGSLTMGNNGQTFMLANDTNQRYTYDKENSEWTKA